jgi:uncharacterized membrane protein YcgQ (UPF0703/DUF1980 family)
VNFFFPPLHLSRNERVSKLYRQTSEDYTHIKLKRAQNLSLLSLTHARARERESVFHTSHTLFSLVYFHSQVKNVENKTLSTAAPLLSGSSSSSSFTTKTSQTTSAGTHKPPTTTYRASTTTYKSQSSTRSSYANRSSDTLTELDRLRMREEFYATYDVMTGIRIAATLGGFFFLMVFLIVYKSRSHSVKALKVSTRLFIITACC